MIVQLDIRFVDGMCGVWCGGCGVLLFRCVDNSLCLFVVESCPCP